MEVLWDPKEGGAFIFCHRAGALETSVEREEEACLLPLVSTPVEPDCPLP